MRGLQLAALGKGTPREHHRRSTRLVIDDYGDAVGVQYRCVYCWRWSMRERRGQCAECKRTHEWLKRRRNPEAMRARARAYRTAKIAGDPEWARREYERSEASRKRRRELDPDRERELARVRGRRYVERLRQDPAGYERRKQMTRIDNVVRRIDGGKRTGTAKRRVNGLGSDSVRRYVPTAPLVAAIRSAAPRFGGEKGVARAAGPGVSERLLYSWRVGQRARATWDTADAVLLALDLGWWEVFDPEDGPRGVFSTVRSRDVVAWIGAAQAAADLWDAEPWIVRCGCGWRGEREADTAAQACKTRCPRCRGAAGVDLGCDGVAA